MKSNRAMVIGLAIAWAFAVLAVAAPPKNETLIVAVSHPFDPNPALVHEDVIAGFSIDFVNSTFREECMKLGAANQKFEIFYEDLNDDGTLETKQGGRVISVTLNGNITFQWPKIGPNSTKRLNGFTATRKTVVVAGVDEEIVEIVGIRGTPCISTIRTTGFFRWRGRKKIRCRCTIQPETAPVPAKGEGETEGKVEMVMASVGDSVTAGFANLKLIEETQLLDYPLDMAKQIGIAFG